MISTCLTLNTTPPTQIAALFYVPKQRSFKGYRGLCFALVLALITLLQLAPPLRAQPMPSRVGISPEQLLTFADHLLREGEYFRAITEYRRFLFIYPEEPRRAMALFRVGQAFYRGESYPRSLADLS